MTGNRKQAALRDLHVDDDRVDCSPQEVFDADIKVHGGPGVVEYFLDDCLGDGDGGEEDRPPPLGPLQRDGAVGDQVQAPAQLAVRVAAAVGVDVGAQPLAAALVPGVQHVHHLVAAHAQRAAVRLAGDVEVNPDVEGVARDQRAVRQVPLEAPLHWSGAVVQRPIGFLLSAGVQ
ncbi:hypothetical protein EYF80_042181 [Liparis tanakae]|uniref:Uncharacterized protein n=1 Tax=Liparis tanakae TaxID=230148 RepID=A0A4Z2G3A0_9TELE|nr:hypothetical protein EYF80_042181 [Liparis tanakae]